MAKVSLKIKHFFDGVYMYLGLLLAMIGVIFLLFDIVVSGIFLFLSILVFTTVYKLSIDTKNGFYRKYIWFLGLKKGKKYPFSTINKLILRKRKYEHQLSSKMPNGIVEYEVYKAYIVFDKSNQLLIGESKNRNKIEKRVAKLRDQLSLEVQDLTAD